MNLRIVGIDIGTETIKLVELERQGTGLRWTRREIARHHKAPASALLEILSGWSWDAVAAAAVSGRLGRQVRLPRVPTRQAQAVGFRFLRGEGPFTVVSIGGHGFSVLELRDPGMEVFRENSRCSQGTGSFLAQLVERFDLSVEEASRLAAGVTDPAPLSGRCPVILKTDMTHLANKGESRARILAGLFDAVAENVQVLIKPKICPPRVVLAGGVPRSERIREHFRRFVERRGMTLESLDGDDSLYLEALGAALVAAERGVGPPPLDGLIAHAAAPALEVLPALSSSLGRVTRLPAPPPPVPHGPARTAIFGFDIGSTGSKAVLLDTASSEVLWDGYLRTGGSPVAAAQALMRRFAESEEHRHHIVAFGVTGSGREIVGSLLSICYGPGVVFVMNEIAAHARGAVHFDPRVDTIFEIGGQDAKYIRLSEGRVVDAAMNEACSAGTGSFIEEQGSKFAGIAGVQELGREAMAASSGVSLGQHCAVFMAEIVDQAVGAGVDQKAIIAGIYDSIIQNYLNRVKGSRSVGKVIFCQGMPFAADALAAAVARQTDADVVVPPEPGTIGAFGVSLLTRDEIGDALRAPLHLARFLEAQVDRKETFVCRSTKGCGEPGNHCRIDALTTRVDDETRHFRWGGGCSLYDRGTRKKKLPDRSPDPFHEREALVRALWENAHRRQGLRTIALTDEFQLKGFFPLFVTFFRELGLWPIVATGADQATLKRGAEAANVPFCAPMQLYHGIARTLTEARPDILFLPMLRTLPRSGESRHSVACPIVQGSPDMLRWDLRRLEGTQVLSPVIDVGFENLDSDELSESMTVIARELGIADQHAVRAFRKAVDAQERFDLACTDLGHRALAFAREHGLVSVVVLGRPYTIYNKVLNSNVPAILREQGAIAIPVDCYPVDDRVPVFPDMYWGQAQVNLRAAHQIRRTPGVYSIYCSNYSCGPDSFNLHFYGYLMEGKPFAVVETDGHSGDAGTKTRVEAFLHCVRSDLGVRKTPSDLLALSHKTDSLPGIRSRGARVLVPRMGPGAEALAACLRGLGVAAEALPMPTADTVRLGRRCTSGKECVPMTITTGSLLEWLGRDPQETQPVSFFMPTARGPCRFGVYNLLHKIILERLGHTDRVGVWSPSDEGYFTGVPQGFAVLVFTGFMAEDLLLEALYDARPVERTPGAAQEIYGRYERALSALLEQEGAGDVSLPAALLQVASRRLFGCRELLRSAAGELARIKEPRSLPTVLLVGEVYARCDDFTNDFIVDKLEQRGIRVRLAPFSEWLEYADILSLSAIGHTADFRARIFSRVRSFIQNVMWATVAARLGWPRRTSVADSIRAAEPYVRPELHCETVLTVGAPLEEWRRGHIDAVVSVGPLECMPNKIAEAQLFHVGEREGLLSLTIPLNGDPIDPELVDSFAFEVHQRFRKRNGARIEVPEDTPCTPSSSRSAPSPSTATA